MYDYYLKFILSYGKGKEIEVCFHLLENEDKITLDQYGEWIRISSRFHDIDGKKDNGRKAKRNKVSKKDNVKTKSGLIIKLPSKEVDYLLNILPKLSQSEEFKDINVIDLRQKNQIIING